MVLAKFILEIYMCYCRGKPDLRVSWVTQNVIVFRIYLCPRMVGSLQRSSAWSELEPQRSQEVPVPLGQGIWVAAPFGLAAFAEGRGSTLERAALGRCPDLQL